MLQPGLCSAKTTVISLKKTQNKPEHFLPNSRIMNEQNIVPPDESLKSTDEMTCRLANDKLKAMCFFFYQFRQLRVHLCSLYLLLTKLFLKTGDSKETV